MIGNFELAILRHCKPEVISMELNSEDAKKLLDLVEKMKTEASDEKQS